MSSTAGTPRSNRRGSRAEQGRPRLIERAGLVAALDRAAEGAVTVVTAPAGSGKSSLLRAWADAQDPRRHRLAVVHVQRDRLDAQIFWLAVLNAVRDLPGRPVTAEPPSASPDVDSTLLVDLVLDELAAQPGRVTLVIDDVHELAAPGTCTQLTRLLTSLPEHAHAVLAARRDLPLHLHRLRLAGQLAELRAVDLRFTLDETRALLDGAGIAVTDAAVARLHDRTEGWAAGLRLAVISMTGHPDPERFVAEFSGSNRTVAEYLVAEMLERLPADVQDLLLRTSILRRVNGEVAAVLTERGGAERILLDLEDANAFVASLDPERTWFRYHHLFGDLLRLELRRLLPDEVRPLHRRAAGWFADRGLVVEAVGHLQSAGDWAEAAVLFAGCAFGMMLDGQEETMQALLDAFPRRPGADFPELSIVRAMVDLVHGRLDEAADHLAATDTCLASAPEEHRVRVRAAVAALELSLARRRGDLAEVLRQAEFLNTPSGGTGEEPALGSDLRVMALMNLGTVEAWVLGHSDGARHLQEGADLARKIGRPYLEVACLAQLGFASKLPDFTYARRRCEEAVALAERHGWGTATILAPALVTLSCCMVWAGEFEAGASMLAGAEVALRADSGPGIGTLFHLVAGMLHAGRGEIREAADAFATAHALQSQLPHPHALTGYVTGWLHASRARLGSAAEAHEALDALAAPLGEAGEIRNARAVVHLAEGVPADALAAVAGVQDGTASAVHVGTVVEAQVLAALAHDALGDRRAAHDTIEQALELAEPQWLVLPFVMAGADGLLAGLPRHCSAHAALLTDILDVARGSAPASPPASAAAPRPAAAELSPTELRVLRYLPTNLSRPEIARELSVSVNTINTHVRNIYAKLHATDRSSAVHRARELRLLASGSPR